jgi:hypothetical protein
MTTQTHFAFRIDRWTDDGESIVEHVAGAEDFQVAMATYYAARKRWPKAAMTLREGARVIEEAGARELAPFFHFRGLRRAAKAAGGSGSGERRAAQRAAPHVALAAHDWVGKSQP